MKIEARWKVNVGGKNLFAASREGTFAVVHGPDGTLKSWNLTQGVIGTLIDFEEELVALEIFSEDKKAVAVKKNGMAIFDLPELGLANNVQLENIKCFETTKNFFWVTTEEGKVYRLTKDENFSLKDCSQDLESEGILLAGGGDRLIKISRIGEVSLVEQKDELSVSERGIFSDKDTERFNNAKKVVCLSNDIVCVLTQEDKIFVMDHSLSIGLSDITALTEEHKVENIEKCGPFLLVIGANQITLFCPMKNSIAQRCQFDDKITQARLWGDQIIAISSKGYLYLIEPNLGVAVMKPRKLMIDDENLDLTFLAQIENGSKSKEQEIAKENIMIAQSIDQIEIENQQVQEPVKNVEATHVEGTTNRGRLEIEEEEDAQVEEEHKENQEISKPEENFTDKIEIENHDQPLPEAKPATVNEEEEVEERKEERKKAGSKWIKFLERIGSLPQHPIQTGSTTAQFGKQQLRSNTFGKAVSYQLQEEAQIEVEYIDSSLSRKQIIGNTKAYNMCDLGAKGFVLARSGQAANIEEYEDEEETAQAEIFFQALGSDFSWTRHFSAGEALIQVSISSTLVTACSSRGTLYAFSLGGSLISTISVPGSVVALCTFEHLAAVVVSHSLPVDGAQNLTLRLYDLRALSCELLTSLPLSPGSGLIWAGFGDDGSFVTQDSSGIVRLLIEKEIWIPVHVDESERRFWIVGVIDCELVGHFLSHNELEPTLDRKYPIIRLPFGCVQPETKLTFSEEEGSIFFDVMKNKFEREKYRLHRHTKHSQISDPLQRLFQDSIKEPHEIAAQEFEAETKKVNLIRRLAVESSEEYRALQYALQLKSEKHFEVLNDLLGYAKHKKLAENIKRSANDHGLMSYISSNSLGANIALPSSLTEKPKPKPKAKIIEEKEEEGHTFADHKQEIDQAIQKSEEIIPEEKKVLESSSNGFPASINGKPTKNLFTAMAECGDSKNRKPAKRVNR